MVDEDSGKLRPVQFPDGAHDSKGDDLSRPVERLLHNLNLLGTPDETAKADGVEAVVSGPPQSIAIMEAGASALAKWWSLAAGVGLTAASITAAGQGIWGAVGSEGVRMVLVGGAAVILAALVVSIAVMVSHDVRGRAAGAVATIQARASVATTFLSLSQPGLVTSSDEWRQALLVAATLQHQVRVRLKGDPAYTTVDGVRLHPSEGLQVRAGDDWVAPSRVEFFEALTPAQVNASRGLS